MTKKQKINLIRILATVAMLVLMHFLPVTGILRLILYILIYLIIGYDIIIKAFRGIIKLQPLDENLLMTVATAGAIAVAVWRGSDDYIEAVAVMLFYQVGELFQSYAVGRSRRSISELMDIVPDHANIEGENGALEQVDPEEVAPGTRIVVRPGERIPIDGVVVSGSSSLNTAALTGESVPRDVTEGDEVQSGCINLNGLIKVRTTREFGESTASKVMELIEDASSRKSRSENFITRFSRIYTPVVVISALLLAVIPPVITLLSGNVADWETWIYRALTFLVISCPCALVVSIPLSFFAGIGAASRKGVLVKGSNYLELLSETKTVVFDKTGTLTKGVFEVSAVHPEKMDGNTLLHLAAHVERYSTHPIAASLRDAYKEESDDCSVGSPEELAGLGIVACVNGDSIAVGNSKLMERVGAKWHECHRHGTVVHVAVNGDYAGHIVISDAVKPSAKQAVDELRACGVTNTVMLTGDIRASAEAVGKELGIDEVYSGLMPRDKVSKVEELLAEKKSKKQRLAFVGDGINDAPALSRADIGIAMGALGSDAAIEAADIVLMNDDPVKIPAAVRISRKCLRIVKENIWFSLIVKSACLILGALGVANMWIAVFADVGVMVLAVLNSVRCMFSK
ncbi:MAG: cadmium-translocating P-type ATPase [Clostridia bacterium]|nr:cadmium-translocating P-type ATPase [Clostridia bacterium]